MDKTSSEDRTPSAENASENDKKKLPWGRIVLVLLLILFLALQLYPVDRSNPEVVADIIAPDNIKAILRRACYDCHSNETKWLWYSYVAPASILVARDVQQGRERLNFSEWGEDYDEEDTPEMFLDECWESIESGEMPLWFYLPLHPEAVLTDEDLDALRTWCGADQLEQEDGGEGADGEDEAAEHDHSQHGQAARKENGSEKNKSEDKK